MSDRKKINNAMIEKAKAAADRIADLDDDIAMMKARHAEELKPATEARARAWNELTSALDMMEREQ